MINHRLNIRWIASLIISLQCLVSCAHLPAPVAIWERQFIADPEMQLGQPRLEQGFSDHIYFSKEASTGGSSIGGGGCGCN